MSSRRENESRLIVNADDLGRTVGINAGIFAAHEAGLVTSATLMVSYPAAVAAAAALPRHPELGVGLHVALTGSPPVSAPGAVSSLLDDSGRLPARPAGLDGAEPREVLAEVRAQLGRFRELTGHEPTHLDSHHHSHRLPVVFAALLESAREHGLPMRSVSAEMRSRLREAGVATTDDFVEEFYGEATALADLLRILDDLAPGTTELMCHPGRVDQELRETSSYAEERDRELEVLTHPDALAKIAEKGVRLVHFGSL